MGLGLVRFVPAAFAVASLLSFAVHQQPALLTLPGPLPFAPYKDAFCVSAPVRLLPPSFPLIRRSQVVRFEGGQGE